MFQRILVPLDGSTHAERVLPIAARIAHASDGVVILLQVIGTPIEYGPSLTVPWVPTGDILEAETTEAMKYLTGIAKGSDLAGVKVKIEMPYGMPALSILEMASTQQIDLIVMSSHGHTGFKRWMLGSVAQKVARHSSVPVLILRKGGFIPHSSYPDPTRPLHTITAVVALDGSTLARIALEPTAHLVAALTTPAVGRLHLIQVVKLPHAESEQQKREQTDHQTREQANTYLKHIAEHLHDGQTASTKAIANLNLDVTWSVICDNDIVEGLIRAAEKGEADEGTSIPGGCEIVAIATHGRGGLQRWAMGSVAERLLGATRLPLLIVRSQETDGKRGLDEDHGEI